MKQGTPSRISLILRIAIIGICVALCIGVEKALECMSISAPYLIFLPAIAGACAVGGLRAALWAIFFSSLGLWYFFIPPYGFSTPTYADMAHIAVFVGVSVFVCWVIGGLRRANDELSRDNFILGCKITNLITRVKAPQ